MMAPPSARRLCAILSILLALVFAGVQGANALDTLQHSSVRAIPHEHVFLSALTLEEASDAHFGRDQAQDDQAQGDREEGAPVTPHHHHNADHGSGMPAYAASAIMVVRASVRLAIPHVRTAIVARVQAVERPPKLTPTAA